MILDIIFGRVIANKIRIQFSFLKPIVSKIVMFITNYKDATNAALEGYKFFKIAILFLAPMCFATWIVTPLELFPTLFTIGMVFLAFRIVTFK